METTILVVAIIFTVVVLILLPKYAKFIHTQPRIDIERRRQREAEQNSNDNSKSIEKDG